MSIPTWRVVRFWLLLGLLCALGAGIWRLEQSPPAPLAPSDLLSKAESEWLRQHPLLRLAPDPNFPPIEYFDETGRYRGMIADYYALLEARLGVRFEVVRAATWDEVIALAKKREVDILGAAQQTPARSEYLNFSQTIIDIPNVIIVPKQTKGDVDFPKLAGKRLAITRGNALDEYVRVNFPLIEIVPVADDLAGLRDVSFGRADATVVNLAIASYLIDQHGIANLRVAGDSGRSNALHIASRNDWPILNVILSKGLATISEEERQSINRRWIRLGGSFLEHDTLLALFVSGSLVILAVIAVLLINLALRRQVEARTAALNQELAERKQVEEALRRSEERFRTIFDSINDAIFIHDIHTGRILNVNRRMCEMYGYSEDEARRLGIDDLSEGLPPYSAAEAMAWLRKAAAGEAQVFDWRARDRTGRLFWVGVSIRRAHFDAGEDRLLVVVRDITERKAAEEKIQFLAFHDALTELPNRMLVQDRFQQAMAFADRAGSKLALLFLDLDNFKTINDSLGHSIGDALLKQVAERLAECVRDTDTISRQGGDEFLIVLPNLPDADATAPILAKLMERLLDPFEIQGHELITSLSVGVALYPDDGKDFDTLTKKADMAMYRAKDAGRNTYRFFDKRMNVEAMEHLSMLNGLRRALEHDEFVLHYQPQIDLASGQVVGAEALIRWQHPDLGLVPPGRFIAIAEESRLIVPIGEWVLGAACRQAVAWKKAGLPQLVIAVNLSAVQFKRGDMEQTVISALEKSGHDPNYLELEMTESILIQNIESVLATVKRLKLLGVKLSIDDFGTGYSSLSYLKRFDIDKLKIDQSFIRDLTTDPEDAAIVRAIIQMGQSLNLKTLAEGVENIDMLEHLRGLHCDEAQGYYFSRPMPAEEFADYLARAGGSHGSGLGSRRASDEVC